MRESAALAGDWLLWPQECWLTDDAGARFASDLRLVAVERRASNDASS